MKTSDRQILSNLSKNMSTQYISIYSDNSTKRKFFLKTWGNQVRQRKPIPVSWRLEKEWCKNGDWDVWHWVIGSNTVEREIGKTVNSYKKSRENAEKNLKNSLQKAKHAFFATEVSRQQVTKSSRQNTQRQNCEKFSKCFLRLEGLPARESRVEPRKSLRTPRSWTFHLQTSRQN